MNAIFQGIKVLDFTWVVVGPRTTRYLGDQGATVIKVENLHHPGILRQAPPFKDGKPHINGSTYFAAQNPNKMSIGVDMTHKKGMEIIKKLIQWADVVAESFSPGTMEKLGLSYDAIKAIKKDIILLRTSMLGSKGPRSRVRGYGFQLVGYSGFTYITGWPDRVPVQPFGPYTDSIAPRFAASALLAALIHRKKTGKGVCIDLSQHEAGLQFLTPMLLDAQLNKVIRTRQGNTHPDFCPHGVYPCKGRERWAAICIQTDGQWKTFCRITDQGWEHQTAFSTASGRKQHQDAVNRMVGRWTQDHSPEEITKALQDQGIPAGVVQTPQDLVCDPQLSHRQALWYVEKESLGRHAVFGQGSVLSKTPPVRPKPAPSLGEHTFQISKEILNLSDDEIVDLLEKGVLQMGV